MDGEIKERKYMFAFVNEKAFHCIVVINSPIIYINDDVPIIIMNSKSIFPLSIAKNILLIHRKIVRTF